MTSTSVPPRLEMRGVTKSFGATQALAGVDLAVAPGQVHALVGENGAGKSTLMKTLSGAVRADAGQMWLDGVPFAPEHPLAARRLGVAMIYQELSLAPHLTVEENITLGVETVRFGLIDRAEVRRRATTALAELGHPELQPETRVSRLTVAQQQIVEIARALAIGCRALVLDEPTSSLPKEDVAKLFAVIKRLKAQGQAVIYISHVLEEVLEISDRYTVLRDGRVAGGGVTAEANAVGIVTMMVGRDIGDMYARSAHTPGEVLLELEDLAGLIKPESASLSLRRGEVLGLAGLVGAGRTELLRAVFGLDPARRGRIKIGAYLGPASPARRWRQGVGMVSDDRKGEGLALPMSLADNVTLSKLEGLGPFGLVTPSGQDAAAARWIQRMDIRCRGPRQKVGDLSGGNQQKAAIARLLHHDVDALFLDEPTRGIDVASKAQIYKLIDDLVSGADGGRKRAVLISSSYLPELLGVCDRVAVMRRGRLGPARPVAELDERKLMMEATGQTEED